MAVPEIRLTFDADNFSTFIKELLNLESRVDLLLSRLDSKLYFKCNDDVEVVRKEIKKWLLEREERVEKIDSTDSSKEPEKTALEKAADMLKGKQEE